MVSNKIKIDSPYVKYKIEYSSAFGKDLHVFSVSIVSLLENNIEPNVDDNGDLYYTLLNPKTGNEIHVSLAMTEKSMKWYTNFYKNDTPEILIKLIVT